jgi:outer membrane protein OmpA-like peptidoglycan-associated protein
MMKRALKFLLPILLLLFSTQSYSQLAETSWAFGIGGTYPRFTAVTPPSYSAYNNYGGYISLQRNFTEHVALRLSGNYNHMETRYDLVNQSHIHQDLNSVTGDIDLIYYFVPCDIITPYLVGGFGGMIYKIKNAPQAEYNGNSSAYQFNMGVGGELRLTGSLDVKAEFTYNLASTNDLDGRDAVTVKGLFNTTADAYARLSAGIVYYFSKGKPSHLCDEYEGVRPTIIEKPAKIDYAKIEEMIKKLMPKEQSPVVSVPAPVPKQHWVLIGVDFNFNSAKLKREAYPVLLYTIQILQNNPDMKKIEIQGYTDNIGSQKYNLKLSERRAETVRNYLVDHGVNPDRLTSRGYGESNPIATNKTAEGRAANRRIEFKVIKNK